MSDSVAIAMIGMIGSLLTATMTIVTQMTVKRNERTAQKTNETIIGLEKNTNSIKDALVTVTAKAAYAKGVRHANAAAGVVPAIPATPPVASSDELMQAAHTAAAAATAAAEAIAALMKSRPATTVTAPHAELVVVPKVSVSAGEAEVEKQVQAVTARVKEATAADTAKAQVDVKQS